MNTYNKKQAHCLISMCLLDLCLLLRSTSDKASQNTPSQNAINQSHYAQRVSPIRSGRLCGIPTVQATAWRITTKTLCAVHSPSAFESGIFCLLFFAAEKK